MLIKADELRVKHTLVALAAIKEADEWVSAIEAAQNAERLARERLGINWPWSWRPVAFALRRLAALGIVEERIVTYRGQHRTKEHRRQYRFAKPEQHPLFGTVYPVPQGAHRRVVRLM